MRKRRDARVSPGRRGVNRIGCIRQIQPAQDKDHEAQLAEARAEVKGWRRTALDKRGEAENLKAQLAEARAEVERLRIRLAELTAEGPDWLTSTERRFMEANQSKALRAEQRAEQAEAKLKAVVEIREWYGARHPNSEILVLLDSALAAEQA